MPHPSPSSSRGNRMKAIASPPALPASPAQLPPVSPRRVRPGHRSRSAGPGQRARGRPRGRRQAQEAAAPRGRHGPPGSSEAAGAGWLVGGAAGLAGDEGRRARKWPPDSAPGAPPLTCSRPPAASGAGREATHCSLGRPFIPARSAAARPTRAANPRPRVAAAAGNPGAGNRLAMTRTEEAMSAAGLAVRGGGVPGGREDGPTA